VTQNLLNCPKIGSTLQQVGRRTVPQTMRSQVKSPIDHRSAIVNNPPGGSHIQPFSAPSEQERRPAAAGEQGVPAVPQPAADGLTSSTGQGNDSLLAALAVEPDDAPIQVEVADIEATEFSYPGAGAVEHLEDRHVAQGDGPPGRQLGGRLGLSTRPGIAAPWIGSDRLCGDRAAVQKRSRLADGQHSYG